MAYRYYASLHKSDITRHLNGTLVGAQAIPNDGIDLDGLTLVFTSPAAVTVTFSGTDLTFADIIAEIEGTAGLEGVASAYVSRRGTVATGRFPQLERALALSDPAGGAVTLDDATSTAAAALGFSDTNNTASAVTPTNIINEGVDASGHHYVLIND